MTLTFPPKIITKSKTCNGDEWLAEEKGNKRKMSKLSEKAFLPLGTSVASSETVIAPFDKKNQFGTLAFSHNSNFKFWLERGTFYAKSGSQGRQRRNSGCFRNVTNIFPLVDLGQN